MKATAYFLTTLVILIFGITLVRGDDQLNLDVVKNYTEAIQTGNFNAILSYVSYLSFSAKLYGDKNVFPWMGEYPTLTDYAKIQNGYAGIINQTGSTIEWTFSSNGKVYGSGSQTGMCVNGNSFSVSYASVMTLSGGLIVLREDWFDTATYYERCFCGGKANYLECNNGAQTRSLASGEERLQVRATSGSQNVNAGNPATALQTFLNELTSTSTVVTDDFSFTLQSVFNFPLGAFTTGRDVFSQWETTKNDYVASIAYYDSFSVYSSTMSILTAKANFTMKSGKSAVVPMVAYGTFNDTMYLDSVRVYLDTFELGKALCLVSFDCGLTTPQSLPVAPVAAPLSEPLGAIPRPPPAYVRPPTTSSAMTLSAISLASLFCILTLMFFSVF